MTQLSIFDYEYSPDEPKCYSCVYAIRRGNFRLCDKGEMGYKHIGETVRCRRYKQEEGESETGNHKGSRRVRH